MGEIIFSPELTIPDVLLLRNLADDIQRHEEIKGAGTPSTERDEGYASTGSGTPKAVSGAWLSYELIFWTR
jgi:hypothetical protein